VHQRYLPDDMRDAVYYQPSRHGYEQEIAERMDRLADGARPEPRSGGERGGQGGRGERGDGA
jgi:hypothetical protein